MLSKQVTDRQKSATLVIASARANEAKIAQGMYQLLEVPVEHGTLLIQKMGNQLEGKTGAMVAADHAHLAELGDDASVRAERDQQAARVNEQLVDVRDVIKLAFGDNELKKLGFDGRTPVDPVQVHSLGKLVCDNLATWQPNKPSRLSGLTAQNEVWRASISDPLEKLESSLESVARETREAEATQVAKNRAIEEYDKVFALTAGFLSLMLEIIGERELAKRVRPSRRRAGQIAEVSEATTTSDVEQPAPQEG
ncbi:MAG TPA: hypothetical protein DFS52_14360 [Myxococcales bacterium]|jgi:hypothetical protein|nr:hypothetical protein [Myxococcales bacterium]